MSSVVTTTYTARLLPNMRQRFTRRRGGEHLLKTILYTGSHWAQLVTTIGSYYSANDTIWDRIHCNCVVTNPKLSRFGWGRILINQL